MDYYLNPFGIVFSSRTALFIISMLSFFLIIIGLGQTNNYTGLILTFITAILWILPNIKLLYIWLRKRPVLTTNDLYIYNHLDERKYYWEDIEEVIAENNYLKIILYVNHKHLIRPYKHLSRFISNLFSKKSDAERQLFYINIHILDIDRDLFLEKLNNYSILSQGSN